MAQYVDIQTVEALQLRAPGLITTDKNSMLNETQTGYLYPKVLNTRTRKLLTDALLDAKCIIPSIKTLHENLKHLEIGSKILKDVIVNRTIRNTLRNTLKVCWSERKRTFIQTAPDKVAYIRTSSYQACWDIVYRQIWVFVLRNFADLGGRAPRKERGEALYSAEVNNIIQFLFAKLAKDLGFETDALQDCIVHDPRRQSMRISIENSFQLYPEDVERLLEDLITKVPLRDIVEPHIIR